METILFFILAAAWIWSVARGIHVSLICVICNFLFPPISQLIFSFYEEKIKAPFYVMVICIGLLFYLGEISFEFVNE